MKHPSGTDAPAPVRTTILASLIALGILTSHCPQSDAADIRIMSRLDLSSGPLGPLGPYAPSGRLALPAADPPRRRDRPAPLAGERLAGVAPGSRTVPLAGAVGAPGKGDSVATPVLRSVRTGGRRPETWSFGTAPGDLRLNVPEREGPDYFCRRQPGIGRAVRLGLTKGRGGVRKHAY